MTTQRQIAESREEEVVSRWKSGEAISSIARDLEVRPDVISRVLFKHGFAGTGGNGSAAYARREKILTYIEMNPGCTVDQIVDRLGISRSQVIDTVSTLPQKHLVVTRLNKAERFTDDEIRVSILVAWAELEEENGPLPYVSMTAYSRYRSTLSPEDRSKFPSTTTIANRYGAWANMCDKFGIPHGTRAVGAGAKRKIRADDLTEAVERFLLDPERTGGTTCREYEEWAKKTGAPSAALVRRRLGRWSDIVRDALRDLKTRGVI